jgi:hypothetical protein
MCQATVRSFITVWENCYMGIWVKEFLNSFFFFSFSFLQDRYNAEVIDVRYLILSWVDV